MTFAGVFVLLSCGFKTWPVRLFFSSCAADTRRRWVNFFTPRLSDILYTLCHSLPFNLDSFQRCILCSIGVNWTKLSGGKPDRCHEVHWMTESMGKLRERKATKHTEMKYPACSYVVFNQGARFAIQSMYRTDRRACKASPRPICPFGPSTQGQQVVQSMRGRLTRSFNLCEAH